MNHINNSYINYVDMDLSTLFGIARIVIDNVDPTTETLAGLVDELANRFSLALDKLKAVETTAATKVLEVEKWKADCSYYKDELERVVRTGYEAGEQTGPRSMIDQLIADGPTAGEWRDVLDGEKIQCIKKVRERTGMGLKDSKEVVDAWFAGKYGTAYPSKGGPSQPKKPAPTW